VGHTLDHCKKVGGVKIKQENYLDYCKEWIICNPYISFSQTDWDLLGGCGDKKRG